MRGGKEAELGWAGTPAGGWEVGAVLVGVVSFWNMQAGWGKIKRESAGAGGRREIFVHNTQLPMDARRRWLKRGERVRFTVAVGAKGKGPQATKVVAAGLFDTGAPPIEGAPGPLLLCQQTANPKAFKRGFLDRKPRRKKKR